MRAKLEDFQQHISLITAMRNPGLRDRHWERITNAVGFSVKADAGALGLCPGNDWGSEQCEGIAHPFIHTLLRSAGFSLNRALQLGLPKFISDIEEMSEYASKEYSLEKTLDKMQGDWTGVKFDYVDWRQTGSQVSNGRSTVDRLVQIQIILPALDRRDTSCVVHDSSPPPPRSSVQSTTSR